MRLYLLLVCLCIGLIPVMAQQSLSDSLQKRLSEPLPDTTRVLMLEQLGRTLMYSQPVVAMQYIQEGLRLAQNIGYGRGEARILNRMGTIFRITGNYDRSLQAHLAAISVAEAENDLDVLARTNNNLGNLYVEQANWARSIEYFNKARVFADRLDNDELRQMATLNMGYNYANQTKLDSALKYDQLAYALGVKRNSKDIYIELSNLANVYKQMGRYPQALSYYRQSIPACIAFGDNRLLSQMYYELAEVFQKTNRPDSALHYARKSLEVAKSSAILRKVTNAYAFLSELYEPTDPRQALAYLKLASATKDSLVNEEKVKNFQNIEFNERMRQEDAQRLEEAYRTRITMYALVGGIVVLVLIALILYRNNRHKQKANGLLQKQRDEISAQRQKAETALVDLKATQAQLIQKEKLASLGELTAGIAHEIQNPLNFVNNFSEVSTELLDELKEEAQAGHTDDVLALADDLRQNLGKITHHGKRAGSIVRGMLEHSRASTGEKTPTNLNALADEYIKLAYHGQRAKDKAGDPDRPRFTCQIVTDFDPDLPPVQVVAQDIGRVLLNLYNNAFYAVEQRSEQAGEHYQPTVWVSTRRETDRVVVCVRDNGMGIPEPIRAKIFQPFFTTKPTGEGTGLGLSLSYDIVTKGHGGTMEVESVEGEGTQFVVRLPA
ncbi:tetratricopeptide repeat protein [Rudanella paleaurantiibacter]|uniref:histidine kinase n=1 Tax=Rudanella paleaurantiibacter TaxID=2614655 RepID=A0A7J5TZF6_9BACT|nr:tetratricopeptide repeat protein [Rudanella paleaurantiibacter]KAB7729286.1 tetratricopeptide repeat protein [Rudanella paleaurantiibacter]